VHGGHRGACGEAGDACGEAVRAVRADGGGRAGDARRQSGVARKVFGHSRVSPSRGRFLGWWSSSVSSLLAATRATLGQMPPCALPVGASPAAAPLAPRRRRRAAACAPLPAAPPRASAAPSSPSSPPPAGGAATRARRAGRSWEALDDVARAGMWDTLGVNGPSCVAIRGPLDTEDLSTLEALYTQARAPVQTHTCPCARGWATCVRGGAGARGRAEARWALTATRCCCVGACGVARVVARAWRVFAWAQARESYFSGHPHINDEMFDRVEARGGRRGRCAARSCRARTACLFFRGRHASDAQPYAPRAAALLSQPQERLRAAGSDIARKWPRCSLRSKQKYSDALVRHTLLSLSPAPLIPAVRLPRTPFFTLVAPLRSRHARLCAAPHHRLTRHRWLR
jgi:hypothetical protein